jgi:HD-GYP domain-containing protein (c-di-GMP phosphodiesterase class II)
VKPVDLADLLRAVQRVLRRRDARLETQRLNSLLREEVALRTAELQREREGLQRLSVATLEALVNALEAKDRHLRGHSARVADLSTKVAVARGLPEETVEAVRTAARLHDIGKIGIRESILNKQGPLTDEEFAHVKTHTGHRRADPLPPYPPRGRDRLRAEPSRAVGRQGISRRAQRGRHSRSAPGSSAPSRSTTR